MPNSQPDIYAACNALASGQAIAADQWASALGIADSNLCRRVYMAALVGLGSDTGGSIRIPAALSGNVALKAQHHRPLG